MSHTPGPWEVQEIAHGSGRVYRVEINAPQYLHGRRSHTRYIANIVDYHDWTDQPANARLIAAAPELLAAAKSKLANCDDCKDAALMPGECCSDECVALSNAIAKAEGKSPALSESPADQRKHEGQTQEKPKTDGSVAR